MIEFTVAVVGCTPVGPLSNHWFLRESKHKGATRVLATREAKREKEKQGMEQGRRGAQHLGSGNILLELGLMIHSGEPDGLLQLPGLVVVRSARPIAAH